MTSEPEKRRELQLMLLREGFTQDEAREMATGIKTELLDPSLERMRENAMRFPERQIVPPGTIDLADVKSQREAAISEAEEAKYYENQTKLAMEMAQSFSPPEMPTAVLQALLGALETNGIDRLDAIADIIQTIEVLRKVTELRRQSSARR
jgi:hypothetical protein